MKTLLPALIHTSPPSASASLAGLPLLDRLTIIASRSGCPEVHIHFPLPPTQRPHLKRSRAWNITVHWHTDPFPPHLLTHPHLQLSSDWLPSKQDLQLLIRQGVESNQPTQLTTATGTPTPIQFIPASSTPSAIPPHPPNTLPAQHLCCPVTTPEQRQSAARALWNSITSSSDGFVDVWFNRPVGRLLLSKWLIHTPFTPNQISLSSILMGVYGAWCLSQGHPSSAIAGALWFQASAMVDCVDGDVARMAYKETKLGQWLDLAGDQIVHIAIFAGITLGLHRMQTPAPVLALGTSTILGALLSFLVILRSILRPYQHSSRLQKLIDGATSRDFSVLVLLLACIGHLEWFLWMSAIGSHVFWITALALQLSHPTPPPSPPAPELSHGGKQ